MFRKTLLGAADKEGAEKGDIEGCRRVTAGGGGGGGGSPAASYRRDLKRRSHPRVARFVDDDRLPRLVHVVVHAKVGCHAMQQHAVVGGHLREFLVLVAGGEREHKMRVARNENIKINYKQVGVWSERMSCRW